VNSEEIEYLKTLLIRRKRQVSNHLSLLNDQYGGKNRSISKATQRNENVKEILLINNIRKNLKKIKDKSI